MILDNELSGILYFVNLFIAKLCIIFLHYVPNSKYTIIHLKRNLKLKNLCTWICDYFKFVVRKHAEKMYLKCL